MRLSNRRPGGGHGDECEIINRASGRTGDAQGSKGPRIRPRKRGGDGVRRCSFCGCRRMPTGVVTPSPRTLRSGRARFRADPRCPRGRVQSATIYVTAALAAPPTPSLSRHGAQMASEQAGHSRWQRWRREAKGCSAADVPSRVVGSSDFHEKACREDCIKRFTFFLFGVRGGREEQDPVGQASIRTLVAASIPRAARCRWESSLLMLPTGYRIGSLNTCWRQHRSHRDKTWGSQRVSLRF